MVWICKSCLKPWLSFNGFQISNGFKLDDFFKAVRFDFHGFSSLFDEFVCKLGLFWHSWAFKTLVSLAFLAHAWQFTHERVEYNVFCFKGSKSLKTFKISLNKLFVHIGENSQILTVSNKKQPSHLVKNSLS
jgi:hypothetical protein